MTDALRDSAVLIVSDTDWTGMMLQKQQWATRFAAVGHPVCYVNKTPQRSPRLDDVNRLSGLLRGRGLSPGHIAAARPAPEGVRVANLRVLPPSLLTAAWNRRVVDRFVSDLKSRWDRVLMITYTPTPAILHLKRRLDPWLSAYVCVHNYAATPGVSGRVKASERHLGVEVDEVFCDSLHLSELWSERLGRTVPRLMPACDPVAFRAAWRGDELEAPHTVGFFGSSFTELDLPCYRAVLDAGFRLKFIGPRSSGTAEALGDGVTWHPPVENAELPDALRDVDALMLCYRQTERNRGVIPGKFFECLATGKPLIMSPLPDMAAFDDCVNVVRDAADVSKLLSTLTDDARARSVERRLEIAAGSSWEERFAGLRADLAASADRKAGGRR